MAVMTAVVPNMHYDETHQVIRVITMAVYAPPHPSDNWT